MRRLSIPLSLVTTALATLIFNLVQGAELEIRQEAYTYRMSLTKDISTETFVITTPRIKPSTTTSSQTSPIFQSSSQTNSSGSPLSIIHFQFDSAKLTPEAAAATLEILSTANLTKNSELAVIGYTCSKGTDELNQTLSKQRAEIVAILLRNHGYTVKNIQGKGAADPVTTDPEQLYLNRRVEVEILAK